MIDTTGVNGKTIWCLKHKKDISKFSSYNSGWNLAKVLALAHVRSEKLRGLTSMVQLKTGTNVPMHRYQCTGKRKKNVKYTRIIVEERLKKIISQCPKNNASHVIKVFVEHIP